MSIKPERLRLALDQLDQHSGFDFERFSNSFLAAEMPGLRPVGGIHDAGRDAFIHSSDDSPGVFCQHSVTKDWKRKVSETLDTLRSNGFQPRELIYTTNRDIQREADDLRASLRKQGLSLDIRDRGWFEAVANTSPGRTASAEWLAQRYVDPLLSSRKVIGHLSVALTDEEERVVTTYLQLELRDKDPGKGLTKSCVEALITYTLREATPETLVPRDAIRTNVARSMPGSTGERAYQLTDGSLARLVRQDVVKHHRKEDGFTLAFPFREKMAERLQAMLAEGTALLAECATRVEAIALKLGIDFAYESSSVAADALVLLNFTLCERGRLAALAAVGKGTFFARLRPLEDVASELLKRDVALFSSVTTLGVSRFLAIVPTVAEEFAQYPTERLLIRLRSVSDAYCLQFMLQQTPDVQGALRKLLAGTSLLVDTSVLIPCMAERLLPAEQRRLTNLLRGAAALGCQIVVGDDVLNEIDTHLERVRYGYRVRTEKLIVQLGVAGAGHFEAALISAFLEGREAGRFNGSFDDFVELLKGKSTPLQDLVEYLREDLSVEFDEMRERKKAIDQSELATLFESWKAHKRRRPWVDEAAFEMLVLHDVRAFLLVELLRRERRASEAYGHRWWWLVRDGNAFHFDRTRRTAGGGRVCMSPTSFRATSPWRQSRPGCPLPRVICCPQRSKLLGWASFRQN